jgi:hypothetical protein
MEPQHGAYEVVRMEWCEWRRTNSALLVSSPARQGCVLWLLYIVSAPALQAGAASSASTFN